MSRDVYKTPFCSLWILEFFNFLCKWLNVISERETRIYLLTKILIYSHYSMLTTSAHIKTPVRPSLVVPASVISRPPPHYREIMPNYRKVIFLLPPSVNIMTITWVLCRRAVRSNELIECSTAPPPPRPTVTPVISIGMGYGSNLKSICSKLCTQRANSKSDYENNLCSTDFKVAHRHCTEHNIKYQLNVI